VFRHVEYAFYELKLQNAKIDGRLFLSVPLSVQFYGKLHHICGEEDDKYMVDVIYEDEINIVATTPKGRELQYGPLKKAADADKKFHEDLLKETPKDDPLREFIERAAKENEQERREHLERIKKAGF